MGKPTTPLKLIDSISLDPELPWIMTGFGFGCLFFPHELFRQLQALSFLPDKLWGALFLLIGLLGLFGTYRRRLELLVGVYLSSAFLLATIAWSLISQGVWATMTTYLVIALSASYKGAELVEVVIRRGKYRNFEQK